MIKMTKKAKDQKKDKIAEAEEYYQKGMVFGQQGDADGAIECWQKAVELNPDYFQAWYDLGNAYYSGRNDFDSAYKYWQKALELKPDDNDVLYNLGNAYRERGEFDKAIDIYKKVIGKNPKDHEAWNNMANAYSGKGEIKSAIECWEKALEIKPDKVETWYNLGVIYFKLEEFDKSIECTHKALEFYPKSDELHRLLNAAKSGKEAQKQKQSSYQDAIITYKIVVRMFQIIQGVFFQNSIPTILFSDIRSLGM